jgi:hypothetical protein
MLHPNLLAGAVPQIATGLAAVSPLHHRTISLRLGVQFFFRATRELARHLLSFVCRTGDWWRLDSVTAL